MSDADKPKEVVRFETCYQDQPGRVWDDQQRQEQWQAYQAQREQDPEAVRRENQAFMQMNSGLHFQVAELMRNHIQANQDIADLKLKCAHNHLQIAELQTKLNYLGIFEQAGKSRHIASLLPTDLIQDVVRPYRVTPYLLSLEILQVTFAPVVFRSLLHRCRRT